MNPNETTFTGEAKWAYERGYADHRREIATNIANAAIWIAAACLLWLVAPYIVRSLGKCWRGEK